ncbi:MAG TPA: Xaa-Pro aminopeptidase [Candidatus Angelobacter sp.]|nr:Xaa-Pro aminopeptidase [Candidatus Angelobacter sp.]
MRHTPIDPRLFITNRERLKKLLLKASLAVINANDVLPTNADGTLALRQNSDLFYLTGIEQEETILLLFPDADEEKHREVLILREPNEQSAIWEGRKLTKSEARGISGIQTVLWLSEFRGVFHRLMCECEHVYLNTNEHRRAVVEVETRDARFIRQCQSRYPLHDYQRLARLMHALRIVKSDWEIRLIKQACGVTGRGFRRVLRFVQPGVNETEVEAEFAHEFIRRGGAFAYEPIIAGGANACVLHYNRNDQVCRDGDVLLLDVAASYANYNADMTRTIPVRGRFTRRQKQVYYAVLRVFRQCVNGLRPGKLHKDWQKEAEQLVEEELVNLGLLTLREIKRQDPDKPVFKRHFMHGVGHPIGLDVHDVGFMNEPMRPGWVMTVEPAIYVPAERFAVRLENTVLIGENGIVDLMADIPIEADEIEQLMNRRRRSRTG